MQRNVFQTTEKCNVMQKFAMNSLNDLLFVLVCTMKGMVVGTVLPKIMHKRYTDMDK